MPCHSFIWDALPTRTLNKYSVNVNLGILETCKLSLMPLQKLICTSCTPSSTSPRPPSRWRCTTCALPFPVLFTEMPHLGKITWLTFFFLLWRCDLIQVLRSGLLWAVHPTVWDLNPQTSFLDNLSLGRKWLVLKATTWGDGDGSVSVLDLMTRWCPTPVAQVLAFLSLSKRTKLCCAATPSHSFFPVNHMVNSCTPPLSTSLLRGLQLVSRL